MPMNRSSGRTSPPIVLAACLLTLAMGCRSDKDDGAAKEGPGVAGQTSNDSTRASAIRFRDVTGESGIEFVYKNGEESGRYSILESLGGGVALLDYDGDGDWDLFYPGGGGFDGKRIVARSPALYRNDGAWRMTDVTESAGLSTPRWYSHGTAVADYDNDGFPDLLVTGYGGMQLYHNEGDGSFRDVTESSGPVDDSWSSSAAFGDLDGDGVLDLYVVHYVDWSFDNDPYCAGQKKGRREVCPPSLFEPLPDKIFRGDGQSGFTDATEAFGLVSGGKGLSVVLADLDLDGDLDAYVGNDNVVNFLYRNEGNGRLREVAVISGAAGNSNGAADGSMGVDVGDYNLDGKPDLWVANFERENFALYQNYGDFRFRHVSRRVGVTAIGGLYVGWGTALFDPDRDGDLDIVVANGHVVRDPANAPLRQRPLLFENENGKRLTNVAPMVGDYFASPHQGRGLTVGDLDRDGDLDIAVSHLNEPAVLLRNESESKGRWLAFRLIGTQSTRDAVGAVVTLSVGDKRLVRQLTAGGSYASAHAPEVYFGLGQTELVDAAEIRWPSGVVSRLEHLSTDQVLTTIEPLRDQSVSGSSQSSAIASSRVSK